MMIVMKNYMTKHVRELFVHVEYILNAIIARKKKKVEKADTHEDLVKKQKQAENDIAKIEKEIQEKKEAQTKKDNDAAVTEEDLDAYMNKLTKKSSNNKSLFALQKELNQLKKVRKHEKKNGREEGGGIAHVNFVYSYLY